MVEWIECLAFQVDTDLTPALLLLRSVSVEMGSNRAIIPWPLLTQRKCSVNSSCRSSQTSSRSVKQGSVKQCSSAALLYSCSRATGHFCSSCPALPRKTVCAPSALLFPFPQRFSATPLLCSNPLAYLPFLSICTPLCCSTRWLVEGVALWAVIPKCFTPRMCHKGYSNYIVSIWSIGVNVRVQRRGLLKIQGFSPASVQNLRGNSYFLIIGLLDLSLKAFIFGTHSHWDIRNEPRQMPCCQLLMVYHES